MPSDRPGCSLPGVALAIVKFASNWLWRSLPDWPADSALASPASLDVPGLKVWLLNEPEVTELLMRSASLPKPWT